MSSFLEEKTYKAGGIEIHREVSNTNSVPISRVIATAFRDKPWAHLDVVGMLLLMFSTQTNRACPLLSFLFLCTFLSLWLFQLYFIP